MNLLQKLSHKTYKLLIISISSSPLLGVYKETKLVDTFLSSGKTSETLLLLIESILKQYPISAVIYTRGPGSYMSTKLTYIMLKTLEIIKDIRCYGCSGFLLNGGGPIKAIGNLYFIKEKETIITKKYEQPVDTLFTLPQSIHNLKIDKESIPEYCLPAV